MPTNPLAIGETVQKLLSDRQRHADALAAIDATLARISTALNIRNASAPQPAKEPISAAPAAKAASTGNKPMRRKRRKFAVSGNDSVLQFVGSRGAAGATTKQIQANWKSQGRGGKADNSLTQLVKDGRLKRTPLKDQPGSRYTRG